MKNAILLVVLILGLGCASATQAQVRGDALPEKVKQAVAFATKTTPISINDVTWMPVELFIQQNRITDPQQLKKFRRAVAQPMGRRIILFSDHPVYAHLERDDKTYGAPFFMVVVSSFLLHEKGHVAESGNHSEANHHKIYHQGLSYLEVVIREATLNSGLGFSPRAIGRLKDYHNNFKRSYTELAKRNEL